MVGCCNFAACGECCLTRSFGSAGLKSTTTILHDGDSYTKRLDRTEQFLAECVMQTLEAVGLMGKINLVGLSYDGFVGYSMAE